MSATAVVNAARAAGVALCVEDDDLVLEAAAPPPATVIGLLARHKAAVIALLRDRMTPPGPPDDPWLGWPGPDPDTMPRGSALPRLVAEKAALPTPGSVDAESGWDGEDWQTYFDERAAIAEHDGGLPQHEAEARAYECCISHWLTITPPIMEDDGMCLGCHQPLGEQAVPVLRAGGGHVWLHHACIEKFGIQRRQEARRALAAIGIHPHGGSHE